MTVSGLTSGSTLSSSFTTYVELRDMTGNSLWRAETFVGSGASAPPDWVNAAQVFGTAVVDLPLGMSTDTFELYFGGKLDFGSGGTVTLSEIAITLTYSGEI